MILNSFMIFLFIIGLLLTILSFHTYNKLTNCFSATLRSNLRSSIVIGSILMALPIGFLICKKKCNCEFDQKQSWQMYAILVSLIILGIYISILAKNIKDETTKCNIDLGMIPRLLYWISVIQAVIPSIYLAYLAYDKTKDKLKSQPLGYARPEVGYARPEVGYARPEVGYARPEVFINNASSDSDDADG